LTQRHVAQWNSVDFFKNTVPFNRIHHDRNVLQHLFLDGICALELEDNVVVENVLCACDLEEREFQIR